MFQTSFQIFIGHAEALNYFDITDIFFSEIMRNRMRVAEVWMDDYKKLFYAFVKPKQVCSSDLI